MSDREFPKHFDGQRFYNPEAPQARGFLHVLQWKLGSRPEPSPEFISDVEQSTPPRRVEGSELRITLVNHSTVLIQQGASNILTDPIWSERSSPVSWLGPKRRRTPGVRMWFYASLFIGHLFNFTWVPSVWDGAIASRRRAPDRAAPTR